MVTIFLNLESNKMADISKWPIFQNADLHINRLCICLNIDALESASAQHECRNFYNSAHTHTHKEVA